MGRYEGKDEKLNGKIKLSSAGLVYKFFGRDILSNVLKEVLKQI